MNADKRRSERGKAIWLRLRRSFRPGVAWDGASPRRTLYATETGRATVTESCRREGRSCRVCRAHQCRCPQYSPHEDSYVLIIGDCPQYPISQYPGTFVATSSVSEGPLAPPILRAINASMVLSAGSAGNARGIGILRPQAAWERGSGSGRRPRRVSRISFFVSRANCAAAGRVEAGKRESVEAWKPGQGRRSSLGPRRSWRRDAA